MVCLNRWSGLRLVFTVLALAALSAVMAAACGGAEDEEAKDVAPAATQAPVVQAATAAPAMAATAAPVMAPTAAPVAQVATAEPAMEEEAELLVEDILASTELPAEVQAMLDELGVTMGMPDAATTQPKYGGTLTIQGLEPKLWDPALYQSYRMRMTNSYHLLRLLRFDQGPGKSPSAYNPIPSVAESWDIQDGGKTFVFHLRDGVKWQVAPPGVDFVPPELAGREVVASDWVFGYERALTMDTATRQQENFSHTISFEAPDNKTLVIKNDAVLAAFLNFLTGTLMEVQPPELLELCGDYTKPECSAVGNGTYMYNSYTPGVSTSHVRNPDFWEQPFPYIDEVVQIFFSDARAQDAAFRAGKLDIVGADTCAISGERYRALSTSNPEMLFPSFADSLNKRGIWMRQDKPPFSDVNVRRAVALSIDRVGWVRGPLGGYGIPFGGNLAYGTEFWLPDDGFGEASQWLEYDPERAVELLAAAGYGPGDIKIKLESSPAYGERFAAEAEVSAGFMNAVGIDTTLEMRDYNSFLPVWTDGKYEHAAYQWSQAGFIPEEWMWGFFHSANRGTTHFGINDPSVDAMMDAYAMELDPVERVRLVRVAATHVINEAYNPLGAYWIYFYGQNPRLVNYSYHDEFDQAHAISYAWFEE